MLEFCLSLGSGLKRYSLARVCPLQIKCVVETSPRAHNSPRDSLKAAIWSTESIAKRVS